MASAAWDPPCPPPRAPPQPPPRSGGPATAAALASSSGWKAPDLRKPASGQRLGRNSGLAAQLQPPPGDPLVKMAFGPLRVSPLCCWSPQHANCPDLFKLFGGSLVRCKTAPNRPIRGGRIDLRLVLHLFGGFKVESQWTPSMLLCTTGSSGSNETLVERASNFKRSLEAAQYAFYRDIPPDATHTVPAGGIEVAPPAAAAAPGATGSAAKVAAGNTVPVKDLDAAPGASEPADAETAGAAAGSTVLGACVAAERPAASASAPGTGAAADTAARVQSTTTALPAAAVNDHPPNEAAALLIPIEQSRNAGAAGAGATAAHAGPATRRRATGRSLPELLLQTAEAVRSCPEFSERLSGRSGASARVQAAAQAEQKTVKNIGGENGGLRVTHSDGFLTRWDSVFLCHRNGTTQYCEVLHAIVHSNTLFCSCGILLKIHTLQLLHCHAPLLRCAHKNIGITEWYPTHAYSRANWCECAGMLSILWERDWEWSQWTCPRRRSDRHCMSRFTAGDAAGTEVWDTARGPSGQYWDVPRAARTTETGNRFVPQPSGGNAPDRVHLALRAPPQPLAPVSQLSNQSFWREIGYSSSVQGFYTLVYICQGLKSLYETTLS